MKNNYYKLIKETNKKIDIVSDYEQLTKLFNKDDKTPLLFINNQINTILLKNKMKAKFNSYLKKLVLIAKDVESYNNFSIKDKLVTNLVIISDLILEIKLKKDIKLYIPEIKIAIKEINKIILDNKLNRVVRNIENDINENLNELIILLTGDESIKAIIKKSYILIAMLLNIIKLSGSEDDVLVLEAIEEIEMLRLLLIKEYSKYLDEEYLLKLLGRLEILKEKFKGKNINLDNTITLKLSEIEKSKTR